MKTERPSPGMLIGRLTHTNHNTCFNARGTWLILAGKATAGGACAGDGGGATHEGG